MSHQTRIKVVGPFDKITDFEIISNALTVRSICEEISDEVPADCHIEQAKEETKYTPQGIPARVIDPDGSTLGFVWHVDLNDIDDFTDHLHQVMEKLEPSYFVSADTNIMEAIEMFANSQKEYFYVLEKNDVLGIVRFADLYKPVGRLALLALALETEQLALKLCQMRSLRDNCWSSLSVGRQQKAIDLYEKRFKRKPEREGVQYRDTKGLIGCTCLSDKATMIWACGRVTNFSKTNINSFFGKLEKIRNVCAHPNEEDDLHDKLPRESLLVFLNSCKNMNALLREVHSDVLWEEFRAPIGRR